MLAWFRQAFLGTVLMLGCDSSLLEVLVFLGFGMEAFRRNAQDVKKGEGKRAGRRRGNWIHCVSSAPQPRENGQAQNCCRKQGSTSVGAWGLSDLTLGGIEKHTCREGLAGPSIWHVHQRLRCRLCELRGQQLLCHCPPGQRTSKQLNINPSTSTLAIARWTSV